MHTVPSGAGGLEHLPVAGSHRPDAWHASEATQATGSLPTHEPMPSHMSICEQASPSSQDVPYAAGGFVHWPVAVSQVPTV